MNGVSETDPNIRNKLAQGKFRARALPRMSRCHWLHIAAVLGFVLLQQPIDQTAFAQTAADESQASSQTHTEPSEMSSLKDQIEGVARAIESLKDSPEAEAEEKRAAADLKAQQDMALWALCMFVASGLGTLFGGATILLVWRTLVHTARAAKASQDMAEQTKVSTEAAIRSAEAAEASVHGLERPYLFLIAENGKTRPMAHHGGEVTRPSSIQFRYRNYGRTPAIIREFRAQAISDASQPIDFETMGEHTIESTVIPPGENIYRAVSVLLPDKVTEVLLICGFVRYVDVRGKEHVTEIVLRWDQSTQRFAIHLDRRT